LPLLAGFESFTKSPAQFVTKNLKILSHSACDALFVGRGHFVDTNCFSGVQMFEQQKLAVLRQFETVSRRIISQNVPGFRLNHSRE
jgi:tRNA-dihydrouridine synthase